MGADARGRRHASPAWLKAGARGAQRSRRRRAARRAVRSSSCRWSRPSASTCSRPSSRRLDAWALAEQAGMPLPPIMIYGDDVTHILTEEGIANLLLCRSDEEREQAIRGVAGYTAVGLGRDRARGGEPARARRHPSRRQDLGIDQRDGDPQPARGALHARSRARVGRAVPSRPSAFATGEGWTRMSAATERLQFSFRGRRAGGRVRAARSSASSARAISRCWSSPRADGVCTVEVETSARGFGHDLGGGAERLPSQRHPLAGVRSRSTTWARRQRSSACASTRPSRTSRRRRR